MNAIARPLPPQAETLRKDQIAAIAAIAFSEAGIRIGADKLDFLQARLARNVRSSGVASFRAYIDRVQRDAVERQKFVESLTVHTTSFFREAAQFDWLLSSGLPTITQERREVILWSAACSSGQEGWTSLMVADRYRQTSGRSFNIRLIGTDVSAAIIRTAERAVYPDQEIQSLPREVRSTFFMYARNGDGRHRIIPELRRAATWRRGNLATGAGLAGISADVAFLRNVLIYFDAKTQAKVVNRVVNGLRPGGFLFTGHSETGIRHPELALVQPSIYRKAQEIEK